MQKKVILITGASSGIGFSTAKVLASQGHVIYAAARRLDRMEPLKSFGVRTMEMDVTRDDTMEAGVRTVIEEQGRIVNVASVAGRMCLAYGGWYHVSKYSVEAFSDALRIEVKPFGIAADHLLESSAGTVYEESAGREADLMHKYYRSGMFSGPEAVTRCICRAVNSPRPRLRYNPGRGAGLLLFWHAVLPARVWDAINRMAVGLK